MCHQQVCRFRPLRQARDREGSKGDWYSRIFFDVTHCMSNIDPNEQATFLVSYSSARRNLPNLIFNWEREAFHPVDRWRRVLLRPSHKSRAIHHAVIDMPPTNVAEHVIGIRKRRLRLRWQRIPLSQKVSGRSHCLQCVLGYSQGRLFPRRGS